MVKTLFNNVLLVSGSGRNCGKTTLACNLIGDLSNHHHVIGLKITPHIHIIDNQQELLFGGEGYNIYKEHNFSSGKDSSRMLDAGAREVYFVECNDENLSKVETILKRILHKDAVVVCESGSFASVFKPGYHILVEGLELDTSKKSYINNRTIADQIIQQADFSEGNMKLTIKYRINQGFNIN